MEDNDISTASSTNGTEEKYNCVLMGKPTGDNLENIGIDMKVGV